MFWKSAACGVCRERGSGGFEGNGCICGAKRSGDANCGGEGDAEVSTVGRVCDWNEREEEKDEDAKAETEEMEEEEEEEDDDDDAIGRVERMGE